jgi:hypothetical protein
MEWSGPPTLTKRHGKTDDKLTPPTLALPDMFAAARALLRINAWLLSTASIPYSSQPGKCAESSEETAGCRSLCWILERIEIGNVSLSLVNRCLDRDLL